MSRNLARTFCRSFGENPMSGTARRFRTLAAQRRSESHACGQTVHVPMRRAYRGKTQFSSRTLSSMRTGAGGAALPDDAILRPRSLFRTIRARVNVRVPMCRAYRGKTQLSSCTLSSMRTGSGHSAITSGSASTRQLVRRSCSTPSQRI